MKQERRRYSMNLNREKEADVIEYLEKQNCMQRIIVEALRDRMRKEGKKWQKQKK